MVKPKILCVVGTRPQLIKHAVLAKTLSRWFELYTVDTGQHYDRELAGEMIQSLYGAEYLFPCLNIPARLSPLKRLMAMMDALKDILAQVQPSAVLVYGDTDSTLAGALSAKKSGARLVHVEAGERSFKNDMPEEQNRLITDAMSDVLLCASHNALANLNRERCRGQVAYTGDVMKDLLLRTASDTHIAPHEPPYFFCTLHRSYNKQNPAFIKKLFRVLNGLNGKVFFSVHPATAPAVKNLSNDFKNIQLLPPLPYAVSVQYQKFAEAVITDSGGLQREAYWLRKPCITLRAETEWVETLAGGWNQLLYHNLEALPHLLHTQKGSHEALLYGDGKAADKIGAYLQQYIR